LEFIDYSPTPDGEKIAGLRGDVKEKIEKSSSFMKLQIYSRNTRCGN